MNSRNKYYSDKSIQRKQGDQMEKGSGGNATIFI